MATLRTISLLSVFWLLACGGEPEVKTVPWSNATECNPIAAEWDCMLPFPSDYWATEDNTQNTGLKVHVSDEALPKTKDGAILNLPARYPSDGFSCAPHIAVALPAEIDASGLVSAYGDISASTTLTHQTLILDTQTGLFVEHFSEFFGNKTQSLAIHPLELLAYNRRYIVVVQDMTDMEGQEIEAPEIFGKLREGGVLNESHPELEEHYQTRIFPLLEEAGLTRDTLLLAWDFTTRSSEDATGDALHMRRLMLEALDKTPPPVEITKVEENPNEDIARRIEGIITVPSFLETIDAEGKVLRDSEGLPRIDGTMDLPFILIIPHSVLESQEPARLLQFGHGFFANRSEVDGGFVTPFAAETGMMVIGVDWVGMATDDINLVLERLSSDPEKALDFTRRTSQGILNIVAVTRAAQTTLLELPEVQIDGVPLYDPNQIYFYGLSQGHILGGVFAALTPDLDRVVLSSGGGNFSLIMSRAMPFAGFRIVLDMTIDDPMGSEKFVALGLTATDLIDPISYANLPPLPGRPENPTMLIHSGLADSSVPHLGAIFQARSLGIPQLEPVDSLSHGLESVPGPTSGSALVLFDFDEEMPEPRTLKQNDVHEAVRRLPAAIEQINRYFRPDGLIEVTCDGQCDPE